MALGENPQGPSLRSTIRRVLECEGVLRWWVQVAAAAFAGLSGVLQAINSRVDNAAIEQTLFWMATIFALLSALSGYLLAKGENLLSEIVVKTLHLEEQLRDSKQDHSDAEDVLVKLYSDFERISHLLTISRTMNEIVEQTILRWERDSSTSEDVYLLFIDILCYRKSLIFNFSDEDWSISIYMPPTEGEELQCIASRRADRRDEKRTHRSWARGEGHVGRAFQLEREIVVQDATRPDLQGLLAAPATKAHGYDHTKYRSIAAIPIKDGNEKVLGVVIGTSESEGRFSPKEVVGDGAFDAVEPLRILAATVSTLESAKRTIECRMGNERDGTERHP